MSSIPWVYLDKTKAAEKALLDYGKMRRILDNTNAEIRQTEARGTGTMDILRERLRQAKEYMAWFEPAWNALTESEQVVLDAFYNEDNEYGSGAADLISGRYFIERATVYRWKSRALENLTTLLYGR